MDTIEDTQLTHDNKDDFIVWAWQIYWDKPHPGIEEEVFSNLLMSELDNWISHYYSWGYCYNAVLDELNNQKQMEKDSEERNIRPKDIDRKRELFARKLEEKFKKEKKKYKC